jgi:hypothetical protein
VEGKTQVVADGIARGFSSAWQVVRWLSPSGRRAQIPSRRSCRRCTAPAWACWPVPVEQPRADALQRTGAALVERVRLRAGLVEQLAGDRSMRASSCGASSISAFT